MLNIGLHLKLFKIIIKIMCSGEIVNLFYSVSK